MFQEYPKMLYKHPADKTQEHQTLIVHNADEENAALADCHRLYPYVPISAEVNGFDADCPDGSGSERWPNQGWTEAGDGTGYPGDVPTQAQADAVAAQAQAERDERKAE